MSCPSLGRWQVGTGRCLFSLDFTEAQYQEVTAKLVAAGKKMQADGWWWTGGEGGQPATVTAGAIKSRMGKEIVQSLVGIRKATANT